MSQILVNTTDQFVSDEEYQRLDDAEKECEFEIF
jgi:hypothetical protein